MERVTRTLAELKPLNSDDSQMAHLIARRLNLRWGANCYNSLLKVFGFYIHCQRLLTRCAVYFKQHCTHILQQDGKVTPCQHTVYTLWVFFGGLFSLYLLTHTQALTNLTMACFTVTERKSFSVRYKAFAQ